LARSEPIQVEVRLLPPLNDTAGRDRVRLNLQGRATLAGVIEALLERFDAPGFRRHLYDTEGRLIPAWCAFINERPVRLGRREGLSEPVKDADEITFLLNLAGG